MPCIATTVPSLNSCKIFEFWFSGLIYQHVSTMFPGGQVKRRNGTSLHWPQCWTKVALKRLTVNLVVQWFWLDVNCLQNILDHGLRLWWQLEDGLMVYSSCCWQVVQMLHPNHGTGQCAAGLKSGYKGHAYAYALWGVCLLVKVVLGTLVLHTNTVEPQQYILYNPHHGSWQPNSKVWCISVSSWGSGGWIDATWHSHQIYPCARWKCQCLVIDCSCAERFSKVRQEEVHQLEICRRTSVSGVRVITLTRSRDRSAFRLDLCTHHEETPAISNGEMSCWAAA